MHALHSHDIGNALSLGSIGHAFTVYTGTENQNNPGYLSNIAASSPIESSGFGFGM